MTEYTVKSVKVHTFMLEKQRYSDTGADDYRKSIRSAVYGLWSGQIDVFGFYDFVVTAIRRGFSRAWIAGAAECGVEPGELTQDELDRIEEEIVNETQYVFGYGEDIERGSKANGGLFKDVASRIDMWVGRYFAMQSLGKLYACGDQKLQWRMNPIKEHCPDCLMLDGRVYRASVWKRTGWEPRSRILACRGYKCGCELVPTDAPITPGRPPRVR